MAKFEIGQDVELDGKVYQVKTRKKNFRTQKIIYLLNDYPKEVDESELSPVKTKKQKFAEDLIKHDEISQSMEAETQNEEKSADITDSKKGIKRTKGTNKKNK